MKNLKNITLEISLKPFKSLEQNYIESVCRTMFDQWRNIIRHADLLSVLLWASDGSEILEYNGDMDEEMEWARYIGGANPREEWDRKNDPERKGLHSVNYLYIDNPPVITYGDLKRIIETIKLVGHETTGKPVRVGETFDPGPEFGKSDFKYNRHNEICLSNAMGKKSFICSYAVLNGDNCSYAGFPQGIPEGTPFGTFFGRQCNHFLKDMGFDYIWFSNGLGFGSEAWGIIGAIYDGNTFHSDKFHDTQKRVLDFWRLFREECPDIRIETRGTNLTAGIDLSTDAVPLKDIYEGNFNLLPPPNSPWAAINGDFGLELTGYMTRMAELPSAEDFLYRFYVHDPWWMNSPWLDRYEGQPYDIYLPLAISRINKKGEIANPNFLSFLTIDNSLGEMPEQCPNEIIPHLIKAYEQQPDAVSPLVWVYPFREYHEMAVAGEQNVEKAFFEDWFIRGAINYGFPLSTVVSTDNFINTVRTSPEMYKGVIIVSPVPLKDSDWEKELIEGVKKGNNILLYGSVKAAGNKLLEALNIRRTTAVDGIMELEPAFKADGLRSGSWSYKINHRNVISDGAIDTVIDDEKDKATKTLAKVQKEGVSRAVSVLRSHPEWKGGAMIWVRGTNSGSFQEGYRILVPDNEAVYFPVENLMRMALAEFGMKIEFLKEEPRTKCPVIMIHRNSGAFYFSGYVPETTTEMKFRFPLGAPLLLGYETKLDNGYSKYNLPRAWHHECRVFVEQEENSVLSCKEICSVGYNISRRFKISGLKNAVVRIFPQKGDEERTQILLNSIYPYIVGEKCECILKDTPWGKVLEVTDVTGELMVSTCM